MVDFLRRNAKFVIVITAAFVIIAGLSTALILTNTGHGRRGRDADTKPDRIMLIDELRAENREQSEIKYLNVTGRDERTDKTERSNRGSRGDRVAKTERVPLTEEQIAEKTERILEKLEQKLANGEITQDEYNEKLERIENGDFRLHDRAGKSKKQKTVIDGN